MHALTKILKEVGYPVDIEVHNNGTSQYHVTIERTLNYWFCGFFKKRKAKKAFSELKRLVLKNLRDTIFSDYDVHVSVSVVTSGFMGETFTIKLLFSLINDPSLFLKKDFHSVRIVIEERHTIWKKYQGNFEHSSFNTYYHFSLSDLKSGG